MSISRKVAWCAWFVASVFYAYQYILRVIPNIMLTDIIQQFNIDTALFGQFAGVYYLGYCLMHLPIGVMLDRYGPKNVMTASILLAVVGLSPIIFADNWIYLIIGRFLVGIGSSAAILGVFKIIRMVFTEKYFTRMLSFSVTIGLVGAIYGGGPVSDLSLIYGHKLTVGIFALLGVGFAIMTYFLVPDLANQDKTSVIYDIKIVFSNTKVILICCLAGLMVGPLEGFADAWGSAFLKHVYGFEAQKANYLTSMIYIGMCFAPILSIIAEKTGRYIETIAGAGIVMLIVFMMLIFGSSVLKDLSNNDMLFIGAGFFLVGICCAYQILAIYKASTYASENVAGLTTAVANMIIMSFGYVFHSVIGVVIKSYNVKGEEVAFSYGISIIPIALFIGVVGFLIIAFKERNYFKQGHKKWH